ncbi:MAG: hypothetical protein RQ847_03970 [Wenzhouxiangellaceae bacterium]|nr:hypothetical protein [Wenzhouxiangellaceae bacterium]
MTVRVPGRKAAGAGLALLSLGCGLAGPAFGQQSGVGLDWKIESGPARFGGVAVRRLELIRGRALELTVEGISGPDGSVLGSLHVACPGRDIGSCRDGRISLQPARGEALSGRIDATPAGVELRSGDATIALDRPARGTGRLRARDVPLDWIPDAWLGRFGIVALSGTLDVVTTIEKDGGRFEFEVSGAGFDTADGRFAAADLALAGSGGFRFQPLAADVGLRWTGGEALLGSLYLAPPESPLTLDAAIASEPDGQWRVGRARLAQGEWLDVRGRSLFDPTGSPWLPEARAEVVALDLQPAWRQGLQSLAAAHGWGRLQPTGGRVEGVLAIRDDRPVSLELQLNGAAVDDPDGRVAVSGLDARVDWDRDPGRLSLTLAWDDAGVYRIPLGAASLALTSTEGSRLALERPFRLPILDGALVVDRFDVDDWRSDAREVMVDAWLVPIDLARLTRILGWTEFGGKLSGRFPGIRYRGNRIDFRGGLEVDLFGGTAEIGALAVERPFGTLPALAAEVDFKALDLEPVTGAFEFGQMQGLMSGYIHDLRLLDWQPVRFDAWFRTLDDSPKRRISQQAVDSLSTLGGGGGAALSGTLLRIFDDFPYKRVGLGCRLENNVCRMRGLEERERGGYLIVEGRGLPRLDVVGYQRRVDWPQLMAQLMAVTGP